MLIALIQFIKYVIKRRLALFRNPFEKLYRNRERKISQFIRKREKNLKKDRTRKKKEKENKLKIKKGK